MRIHLTLIAMVALVALFSPVLAQDLNAAPVAVVDPLADSSLAMEQPILSPDVSDPAAKVPVGGGGLGSPRKRCATRPRTREVAASSAGASSSAPATNAIADPAASSNGDPTASTPASDAAGAYPSGTSSASVETSPSDTTTDSGASTGAATNNATTSSAAADTYPTGASTQVANVSPTANGTSGDAGNAPPTHTIRFINQCEDDVWLALTNNANIANPMRVTDFLPDAKIPAGTSLSPVTIPHAWAGRFWGRTGCDFSSSGNSTTGKRCATGDCSGKLECGEVGGLDGPTLFEMNFDSGSGNDVVFYDISLVDGMNLPGGIRTHNCDMTSPTSNSTDQSIACEKPLSEIECPKSSRMLDANGKLIGCKNGCEVTNNDVTCCKGKNQWPFSCGTNHWSMIMKENCPIAYSYAYDDNTSTYVCKATASFDIVFCPVQGSFPNRDHEVVMPTALGQVWQSTPTSLTAEQTQGLHVDLLADGWPGFNNDFTATASATAAATPEASSIIAGGYGSAPTEAATASATGAVSSAAIATTASSVVTSAAASSAPTLAAAGADTSSFA